MMKKNNHQALFWASQNILLTYRPQDLFWTFKIILKDVENNKKVSGPNLHIIELVLREVLRSIPIMPRPIPGA